MKLLVEIDENEDYRLFGCPTIYDYTRIMVGCNERRWLEVGHIEGRREGGGDELSNYCSLCFLCNQAERRGLIRLVGPYERLRVLDREGRPIRSIREIHRAVGFEDDG